MGGTGIDQDEEEVAIEKRKAFVIAKNQQIHWRLVLNEIVNFFCNINYDRNGQNDQNHEEEGPQEFENDVPINLINHVAAKLGIPIHNPFLKRNFWQ